MSEQRNDEKTVVQTVTIDFDEEPNDMGNQVFGGLIYPILQELSVKLETDKFNAVGGVLMACMGGFLCAKLGHEQLRDMLGELMKCVNQSENFSKH